MRNVSGPATDLSSFGSPVYAAFFQADATPNWVSWVRQRD